MALGFDGLPPPEDPAYAPPPPMDYGPIGMPEAGGGDAYGNVGVPPQQFPESDSFWSRLAGSAGAHPFNVDFSGQKLTGLEALLAAVQGFANAKTRGAATQISETEQKNKRLREAATELAKRMHETRVLKSQEDRAKAALEATKAYRDSIAAGKTPPEAPADRLKRIEAESNARTRGALSGMSGASGTAGEIADAIQQGLQPPELTGLYRLNGPVRAELQKRKFDYTAANKDWKAVQRSIATLNGTQQTRLRQAIETAYSSLDVIDQLNDTLAKQVPRGRVKVLNRASMNAAMNGAFGPEAQNTATSLNAQITDVVSELGNAYMGGNSPTDHALSLAAKNLSADWSAPQLKALTQLARQNLSIRRNSIENAAPITPGGGVPRETSAVGRIRVVGPNGESGTADADASLPTGWKKAP